MPPVRSIPISKVPAKTERSHEENQERAYIAASRRSDRSLEARVESARRASEIHKRRTGRSLRVTEQDVVNEEMYEEEDDDLPLHYRRLTAHLNTNSPDFNRRLAAYLTNHVGMRNALSQAISSSYGNTQQFAPPPWDPNTSSVQQVWTNYQQPGMPQSTYPNAISSPTMQASPTSYRASPYPLPGQDGYRPGHGQHSSSVATTPGGVDSQTASTEQTSRVEKGTRSASASSLPRFNSSGDKTDQKSSSVPPAEDGKTLANAEQDKQASFLANQPLDISPLTTSLPPETQMMFAQGFNPYYPFGPPGTNEFEKQGNMPSGFNPSVFSKPGSGQPQFQGMNQTLAPSALDSSAKSLGGLDQDLPSNYANFSAFSSVFEPGQDSSNDYLWKNPFDNESGMGSGPATPGDKEWAAFIDSSSWDDAPSNST